MLSARQVILVEVDRYPRWMGNPLIVAFIGAVLISTLYTLVISIMNFSSWFAIIRGGGATVVLTWVFLLGIAVWRNNRRLNKKAQGGQAGPE